jgi:hypothetical protein
MSTPTQISCPRCGEPIDVQDILAHQLEDEIKLKYERAAQVEKQLLKEREDAFRQSLEDFEEKKKRENELFQERLDKQLKEKQAESELKIRARLQEEQSEQFKLMQQELNEKSEQLKELNRSKAEIARLMREREELKEVALAEAQLQLNQALSTEKDKIRKSEEEKNELRIRELQKKLEDQMKLTEEMRRKQEQGSMQMQGEVQELAIEEWLMTHFPLDTIDEIKKGARGGDCIQVVHTRSKQNCGRIYYESKRTKDFQTGWIEKFKADMREKEADIGVLVTEAMPQSMARVGQIDGVWVCTYEEFKGLAAVLRESVIQVSTALSSQENKGDKMVMLYDYLSSTTFRMQVEAIVEGSMQRIWKEREKQIDKVTTNTIDMYGSIKGIAGSAIQSVKALELPEVGFDEEDA